MDLTEYFGEGDLTPEQITFLKTIEQIPEGITINVRFPDRFVGLGATGVSRNAVVEYHAEMQRLREELNIAAPPLDTSLDKIWSHWCPAKDRDFYWGAEVDECKMCGTKKPESRKE
jgi:hypothetical protein